MRRRAWREQNVEGEEWTLKELVCLCVLCWQRLVCGVLQWGHVRLALHVANQRPHTVTTAVVNTLCIWGTSMSPSTEQTFPVYTVASVAGVIRATMPHLTDFVFGICSVLGLLCKRISGQTAKKVSPTYWFAVGPVCTFWFFLCLPARWSCISFWYLASRCEYPFHSQGSLPQSKGKAQRKASVQHKVSISRPKTFIIASCCHLYVGLDFLSEQAHDDVFDFSSRG